MSNHLPDVLEIKYNILSALNWYNLLLAYDIAISILKC